MMRKFLFVWLRLALLSFCIAFSAEASQLGVQTDSLVLRTSQLSSFTFLASYFKIHIDSTQTQDFLRLPESSFRRPPSGFFYEQHPLGQTMLPLYLTFTIVNDQPDSASFYLYISPQEKIAVQYKSGKGTFLVTTQSVSHRGMISREMYPLVVPGNDSMHCVIKLNLRNTTSNTPYYFIIPASQLDQFQNYLAGYYSQDWFTLVFTGMMLMMLFYMLVKFIQINQKEYLFYSGYIFCMLGFFVIKMGEVSESIFFASNAFIYSYAVRMTQVTSYCMYFLFFQFFLSTKKNMPQLHSQLRAAIAILCFYIVIDFLFMFFREGIVMQFQLWNVVRIGLLVGTTYAVIRIWRSRQLGKLSYYIVTGAAGLGIFAMLAMIFSFYPNWIVGLPGPFSIPLVYFELGIVIELLFFSTGLGYKNRISELEKVHAQETLKTEGERQQFERYRAMNEAREIERGRIARDLHDGLGGMLTGVRLSLSNIKTDQPEEQLQLSRSLDMLDGSVFELRRIAQDLMPQAIQRFGLVNALRDYASTINTMKIVQVNFQVMGYERRLLNEHEMITYRIIQELLNNSMKHGNARNILIQLVFQPQTVELTIEDDGCGFDSAILSESTGSGWANIRSRVSYLMGTYDLQTSPDRGVSVHISLLV